MAVAKRLKELRKGRNLTQKQLAEALNIPLRSIINYENSLREPNSKAMVALERFFGVSGEYLRGEISREDFLQKSDQLESDLDGLIQRFTVFQSRFRVASQDRQLAAASMVETAVSYATQQVSLPDDLKDSLKDCKELLNDFSKLTPDGAAEMARRVKEYALLEATLQTSKKKKPDTK